MDGVHGLVIRGIEYKQKSRRHVERTKVTDGGVGIGDVLASHRCKPADSTVGEFPSRVVYKQNVLANVVCGELELYSTLVPKCGAKALAWAKAQGFSKLKPSPEPKKANLMGRAWLGFFWPGLAGPLALGPAKHITSRWGGGSAGTRRISSLSTSSGLRAYALAIQLEAALNWIGVVALQQTPDAGTSPGGDVCHMSPAAELTYETPVRRDISSHSMGVVTSMHTWDRVLAGVLKIAQALRQQARCPRHPKKSSCRRSAYGARGLTRLKTGKAIKASSSHRWALHRRIRNIRYQNTYCEQVHEFLVRPHGAKPSSHSYEIGPAESPKTSHELVRVFDFRSTLAGTRLVELTVTYNKPLWIMPPKLR
ncbi:hypothetical protein FIBSPDRAFT_882104 [Athelia psychrophila]|uniref:Uncharacterized protein n=1 Tax=Athelia psychrophila TaxID=1759441 RepID=A0A166VI05_9AGAM|nr:hypothetical protein FIBSPDRAFT_882104 [Fibularhizoctonia sp. CBS 109695]